MAPADAPPSSASASRGQVPTLCDAMQRDQGTREYRQRRESGNDLAHHETRLLFRLRKSRMTYSPSVIVVVKYARPRDISHTFATNCTSA